MTTLSPAITGRLGDRPTFDFSDAERDRRWALVRGGARARGLDALIVQGSFGCYRDSNQNLQYLTNVNSEGYLVLPLVGEPTLFSFENGLSPKWVEDWRGAIPDFAGAIVSRLAELSLTSGRIGLVGMSGLYGELNGFPYTTVERLRGALPDIEFTDHTDLVDTGRQVKSAEEIECLRVGCDAMRIVFDAVSEIARPGVRDFEVRGVIMDVLFRAGCDPGSMILYCQGPNVMHGGQSGGWLEPRLDTPLEIGDIILIELDAAYLGYKAQFNQPFAVGEPDEEWVRIFAAAAESYAAGRRVIRAGTTVGELEAALLGPITDNGFTFGNPAFHGLGLGLEAPMGTYPRVNYVSDAAFVLKAGMVIEFEPHPMSPSGHRGASLGCPLVVTETGADQIPDWWLPEAIVLPT